MGKTSWQQQSNAWEQTSQAMAKTGTVLRSSLAGDAVPAQGGDIVTPWDTPDPLQRVPLSSYPILSLLWGPCIPPLLQHQAPGSHPHPLTLSIPYPLRRFHISEGLGEGQGFLQGTEVDGSEGGGFITLKSSTGQGEVPGGTHRSPLAGMCCRICSGAHPSIPCMQEVPANGKATCYSLKTTRKSNPGVFSASLC